MFLRRKLEAVAGVQEPVLVCTLDESATYIYTNSAGDLAADLFYAGSSGQNYLYEFGPRYSYYAIRSAGTTTETFSFEPNNQGTAGSDTNMPISFESWVAVQASTATTYLYGWDSGTDTIYRKNITNSTGAVATSETTIETSISLFREPLIAYSSTVIYSLGDSKILSGGSVSSITITSDNRERIAGYIDGTTLYVMRSEQGTTTDDADIYLDVYDISTPTSPSLSSSNLVADDYDALFTGASKYSDLGFRPYLRHDTVNDVLVGFMAADNDHGAVIFIDMSTFTATILTHGTDTIGGTTIPQYPTDFIVAEQTEVGYLIGSPRSWEGGVFQDQMGATDKFMLSVDLSTGITNAAPTVTLDSLNFEDVIPAGTVNTYDGTYLGVVIFTGFN
jgi:hypothetical protein